MSLRVAVCQVLRWTVRNTTCSTSYLLQIERCRVQPLCIGCRLLYSSASRTSQQSSPHNHELQSVSGKPDTDQTLRALLDMGFTDIQAEQISESLPKVKGGSVPKQALSALAAFIVLGLNSSSVLKLLQKCPELYTVKELQLQQRINYLRKVGLVEGSLQRVVAHYPQILTVPAKTIKNVVLFLREKCLFTAQQVTDILRDSPAIVQENLHQVEYKFQYVFFRMGIKQAEMVKSRLFRFTLDEVRSRHSFLERRGLYQTPDKKGQTTIINPKLDGILKVDQDTFLTEVAKASAEEYDVFQRLMAREWQDEEQQYGSIEADSDDDDDEEEEEEEDVNDETGGKSAYRKQRKK